MKAVVCSAFGLEHAAVRDVPSPTLTADGVRIRVAAVGVSFANLLVIEGRHQNRWEPPFTPGTEVAGEVIECGERVGRVRPGDRVIAAVRTAGYAQEVVAPESTVFALPDGVDFVTGSQFPTIYGTAYGAFVWRARLQPGETVLVHGAGGGSGLAAVELARCLGARVIATAGSEAKLQAARERGADVLIDHRRNGFRQAVLDATGGRGADVIFDPVGGPTFDESLRCIAPDGRIIPMGFAGGTIPQIPANIVLVKNITVIGIYWGYYLGWARQAPPDRIHDDMRAAFAQMLDWAAHGKLRPHTYRTYPLTAFREALAALSGRDVIGRVALLPGD